MRATDTSFLDRRRFLHRAGAGFGMVALADLLARDSARAGPLAPKATHFPAKAKAVIWLFMEGAPSGVDLFDPKPALDKNDGKRVKIDVFNGNPGPLMKSPFKFRRYGESGMWVCEKYPGVAKHVDQMAFVKSLSTESNDHVPALYQINTGIPRPGFPSAGAWVTYGLGSVNENLPGFVVLGNRSGVKGGPINWSSGFLPSTHQGTLFRPEGNPVLNLRRPPDVATADQRAQLDLMATLNGAHLRDRPGEPDLSARIESFELAYRMQGEAADLLDLSKETAAARKMYGLDDAKARSFGTKCLTARRLVERGVRFVQVYSDGEWDAHSDLAGNHAGHCAATDAPIDGLLTDLKARGLLDSTLVIWGGEFGRMPVSQGNGGRDHNPHGFLTWMAGAGIKGGTSYGETDEFGHKAVTDRTSVHDLHATMLHLLGIEHKKLTHFHNGRQYRLTDVAGDVLSKILT
ncbi:DUF1501 domain-containing protein [Limnoglobus roseus]|uniref:DUF1501 domain-containing protein n=1 Tax=Limnoglobus roseus TaxID=2598579 RepID=A0A5C1AIZ9_9BACT|nr:DUF1501 domain-containing protein [Limnoglobus roseus]QEL17976.1 hypothetical protein PX52LOC_04990 [Limnoglobus roseus]